MNIFRITSSCLNKNKLKLVIYLFAFALINLSYSCKKKEFKDLNEPELRELVFEQSQTDIQSMVLDSLVFPPFNKDAAKYHRLQGYWIVRSFATRKNNPKAILKYYAEYNLKDSIALMQIHFVSDFVLPERPDSEVMKIDPTTLHNGAAVVGLNVQKDENGDSVGVVVFNVDYKLFKKNNPESAINEGEFLAPWKSENSFNSVFADNSAIMFKDYLIDRLVIKVIYPDKTYVADLTRQQLNAFFRISIYEAQNKWGWFYWRCLTDANRKEFVEKFVSIE